MTGEELAFYERMEVPLPEICPIERRRMRMAWATFRTLHHRTCDGTGKRILSMYAPDTKHPVYHSDYWWSDNWDALSHGREFDFNRPFFEQFDELLREVPALHQSVIHSENCEYINMAGHCKNCYLSFYLDYCEDCYYIQDANSSRSCVDCLGIDESELCYACVDCTNCYELYYSLRCTNSHDSYFLTDCRGCEYCIGCFNLANKKYHVFNKQVSKSEFEELRASLANRQNVGKLAAKVAELQLQHPRKFYFGHSNDAFSGDHIRNVRNSYHCFHCHELENVKYADYFYKTHNSMDVSIYGNNSEWLYNCLKTGDQCSNNICCLCCWTGSSDNAYCHLVISTKNCFGCSGLRHKQYCILNKQYSAEEYAQLRGKIIAHMKSTGEWGEFFPIAMSPFAYNESMAHDYFPLSKEEATALGYPWRENIQDVSEAKVTGGSVSAAELPDSIAEANDSLLDNPVLCLASGRPFRIIKAELELYRKMQVPPPRLTPAERHAKRWALRNPRHLWARDCGQCGTLIQTSYPPDRPDLVLCESCYLAAVD